MFRLTEKVFKVTAEKLGEEVHNSCKETDEC